jgi:hypothetical protein
MIGVIDSVHTFPRTPPFPFVFSNIRKDQGVYHYRTKPAHAEKIELSRHADYLQLTLIHEVGHFLDHFALNPIKRKFGTDHDPLFEPLLTLWAESPDVIAAQKLLNRFGHSETKSNRTALQYQLTPRELWARSYTQWVVTRAGHTQLLQQLRKIRMQGWVSPVDSARFSGTRTSLSL